MSEEKTPARPRAELAALRAGGSSDARGPKGRAAPAIVPQLADPGLPIRRAWSGAGTGDADPATLPPSAQDAIINSLTREEQQHYGVFAGAGCPQTSRGADLHREPAPTPARGHLRTPASDRRKANGAQSGALTSDDASAPPPTGAQAGAGCAGA